MRWTQRKFGIPLILAIIQAGSNANVVEARALEGRDTPLLVAPPYSVLHPLETDSGDDDTPTTRKTSSTTVQHSTTSTSTASTTKAKSGPKSTSSASTTTATSSATSAAATSANAAPTTEADKQPSSIKYLVPVFALILITLIGWGYSRWYSRRKQQRQDDDAYANRSQPKGPTGQGWKEVKPTEGDYDEKDEWYDGDDDHPEDWENQYVVTETVRTVRSTWGWKETLNAWRSARGKENEQDQLEAGEMGERKTMKLVKVLNKGSSYQTLPDLDGRPLYEDSREDIMEEEVEQVEQVQRTEERGSIRALKDKLASLSYGGLLGVNGDKGDNTGLDRNRSPNKRKIRIKEPLPNVDPPEWIQPGVLSPSATQMLSPPLHPHLFFHPAPSSQSIQGTLPSVGGDASSQTIRAKAASAPHARFPTIPSSATALAAQESYTAIPKMSPRTVRSRSQIENPDPKSSSAKRSATLPPAARPPPRTPKRSNTSASAASNASKTTSATPATIKRSTATTSIPDTTQSKFEATPSRRSTKEKSTPSSTAMAPRKSRQQRKVDQAQNQVEDILKASWSDRAILSSPLSVQSIDGLVARTGPSTGAPSSNGAQVQASGVGSTSPGVESAAVMGGMGGIEQRLAMLNNVKL